MNHAVAHQRHCPRCKNVVRVRQGFVPRYCAICGYRVSQVPPGPRQVHGLAVAALIVAILGLVPMCGAICAFAALLMSSAAIDRINKNPERYSGRGAADAAMAVAIFALGLWVVTLGSMTC